MEEERKQVDYAEINNAEENKVDLVTCTPILTRKNFRPEEPVTPLILSESKPEATPIITRGIVVQEHKEVKQIQ